jgi:hypothetical protein
MSSIPPAPPNRCSQLLAAVAESPEKIAAFLVFSARASACLRPKTWVNALDAENWGQYFGADMVHFVGRLTALKVAKVNKPGMYADGPCL